MPYVNLVSSQSLSKENREDFKQGIAEILQEVAGKGESFLLVRFEDEQDMYFAGEPADSFVFIEVKLVGTLTGQQKKDIVDRVCGLCEGKLGIDGQKAYIVFTEVPGESWGWNKKTFA